jgi:hypothetical protein
MKDFVKKYCESCDNCAARKPSQTQNKAPLGSYVVGQPMERVSINWRQLFIPVTSIHSRYSIPLDIFNLSYCLHNVFTQIFAGET